MYVLIKKIICFIWESGIKGAKFRNFTYLESLPRHAASNVETFY